jgi:4-alpha-glucanotransferase
VNTIKTKSAGPLGGKTVHWAIRALELAKPISLDERSAGVLMHLTSLPGAYGSGDLGAAAYAFADFLRASGQRWWQMLPVTPMGAAPGYSPYSSDSAIAGSPWLISLETLCAEGLLTAEEIIPRQSRETGADFRGTIAYRLPRLRKAFDRFSRLNGKVHPEFEAFCQQQKSWLDDYALFCALKDRHNGAEWCNWERDLRLRKNPAMERAKKELARDIEFHQFVQYQFDRQWQAFRNYCRDKGIGLIGDIPIFVAHDSADVWAHPHLFDLDRAGQPNCVTGYPPDVFNSEGQRWGHPHFVWDRHRAENYRWWLERFRSMLSRFDAVRIDHFLGFDQSWSIPFQASAVAEGQWIPGGGMDFFRAVRKELGEGAQMIAEDIGELSPAALALRNRFDIPGMRVLQFAFDGGDYHLPHVYPKRCVAFTGTHDNDTFVGWYEKLSASAKRNAVAKRQLSKVRDYLGICDDRDIHRAALRSLYGSQANTVIIPLQDLLGLKTQHRMNVPGTAEGNWNWRVQADLINGKIAAQWRAMTELFGRVPAASNVQ